MERNVFDLLDLDKVRRLLNIYGEKHDTSIDKPIDQMSEADKVHVRDLAYQSYKSTSEYLKDLEDVDRYLKGNMTLDKLSENSKEYLNKYEYLHSSDVFSFFTRKYYG